MAFDLSRYLKKALPLFALLGFAFLFVSCEAKPQPVQKNAVAMGSVVSVSLYGAEQADAERFADEALAAITALDTQYLSKTDARSALYRLNANETPEIPVQTDTVLYQALAETKSIYAHSAGKAAVTSGALTALWGFDTDAFRLPADADIQAAKAACDDASLTLADGTVSFRKGQQLNLGSVGKGYACDAALQALTASGFSATGALVNVGGSLGLLGAPAAGQPFRVGLRDPFGAVSDYFAVLETDGGFLSTSGSYEKKFTENGVEYHHLLDLTTGYPAETELCAVTVLAKTGLQSDALSTLCFLLGREQALPILAQYGAEAVFVYTDRTVAATARLYDRLTIQNPAYSLEAVCVENG